MQDKMSLGGVLRWHLEKSKICASIRKEYSPFKIVLKTKNERFFLKDWVNHYKKFCLPHELIIADNGSTDPEVLNFYRDLDGVLVFSYEGDIARGYHNCIHDVRNFPELYAALSDSCDYVIHLDTDEFLIWADSRGWSSDRQRLLSSLSFSGRVRPTTWLDNINSSKEIFYLGRDRQKVVNGLAWGKPFVPSKNREPGVLIHNSQFSEQEADFQGDGELFLLHLSNFSPEQRLSINRQKLAARGFCESDADYVEIVALDVTNSRDPTVSRLVSEMKEALRRRETFEDPTLSEGCVKFDNLGKVEFGGPAAEESFQNLLNNKLHLWREARELSRSVLGKASASPKVNSVLVNKPGDEKEDALRRKFESDPYTIDAYGDPANKKELIRYLISKGDWKGANEISRERDATAPEGWSQILYARALDRLGFCELGREHWVKFRSNHAHHPEATAALYSFAKSVGNISWPCSTLLSKVQFPSAQNVVCISTHEIEQKNEYARIFPTANVFAAKINCEHYLNEEFEWHERAIGEIECEYFDVDRRASADLLDINGLDELQYARSAYNKSNIKEMSDTINDCGVCDLVVIHDAFDFSSIIFLIRNMGVWPRYVSINWRQSAPESVNKSMILLYEYLRKNNYELIETMQFMKDLEEKSIFSAVERLGLLFSHK